MKHCATTRAIVILIGVMLGVIPLVGPSVEAQDLGPDERDRLSPRLQALAVADEDVDRVGPRIAAMASELRRSSPDGEERFSVVVYTRESEPLRQNDIRVQSELDDFVTAEVTPDDLRTLAGIEAVDYVKLARRYKPADDVMRGVTGTEAVQEGALGEEYTGEGTLACIIDTGIDWTHPDFRGLRDSMSSRIHSIWDQTLLPDSDERSPSGFDYGVEYTRSEIEAGLRNSSNAIRHEDTHGHGTHVAGTMAGNGAGSPSRRYRGAAPRADIVAVKTDFVNVIDGLTYCGQVAAEENRPVVVNLSLSRSSGPHDGTAPLARAIDDFVGPGRAVVTAAGNDGNKRLHASHTVSAGDTKQIRMDVPSYTPEEGGQNDFAFSFDGWMEGSPSLSLAMVSPGGNTIALQDDTSAVVETTEGALFYQNTIDGRNGERHIEVEAYDAEAERLPAEGEWTLQVENESSEAVTIHGWMWQTTTGSELVGGGSQYTVGPPATAQNSISVGAWTHRQQWQDADGNSWSQEDVSGSNQPAGAIARFSSRGPTRDGGEKPDLIAPGHWTVSSRSGTASVPPHLELLDGTYALRQGTSMAASATAGVALLLFEHDPSLSGDQLRQLLIDNARTDEQTGRSWDGMWGYGKLDAFQAMADLDGKPVRLHELIGFENLSAESPRTTLTVGGSGAEQVAVRFTAEESGRVQGLFFQTGEGDANRLRESLVVELRTADDGTPGDRVGGPVRIASEGPSNHTLNFVSLESAEASVEEGGDYYVVLYPSSDSGELDLVGEEASVEERSRVYENGSWMTAGVDLTVRVATGVSLDLHAPSIAKQSAGTIVMDTDTPNLVWNEVEDAEEYELQIAADPGFPEGATRTITVDGTSHAPEELASSSTYYWRVRAQGQGHAGPWSSVQDFLYYPASIDVRMTRSFGTTEGPSGYRLVALPGNREVSIASTLEGNHGPDWRAFWDNGQEEDYLVEFEQSSTFHFRKGNGFWLISEDEWSFNESVSSVPLRGDGTIAIELHEGWNIISNPFDLDVSWSAVEAATGEDLQNPWRFADSYRQVTTLPSASRGEAFYFFNDQGLEELVLPYPEAPQAPSGTQTREEKSTLQLITHQDEQRTSELQVGLVEGAEEGLDPHDQFAPPGHFERASLRLQVPSEEAGPRREELAVDYRPIEGNGHTFPLVLDAEAGTPVEIHAEGVEAFEGQQVVLVNSSTAESYDLQTNSTVTLQPTDETQSLRLLIGNEAYVETQKEATIPDEIRFPPNYPNPFEEQTSLEYTLPEPASVRLAIYDVLGRQVDVLVDERQQAGVHTVQWNGRDESDRRVASGLYLARLVVDGTTKVRKMTLVR